MGNRYINDIEWHRNRKAAIPFLGTDTDESIGLRFGVSKATAGKWRRDLGIEPFGKPGRIKGDTKEHKEAVERGYPSILVAEMWEENRQIQDLLDGWKRCVR